MTTALEKTVLISNKLGLHARAATKLAQMAMQFDAEVTIIQDEKEAPANSVLGLLLLESHQGKNIRILSEGPDAEQALNAICKLINDKFDEGE